TNRCEIHYTGPISDPSLTVGASSRSLHNSLLPLAVHTNICKYQGLPFRYF
ncbi:hypothetical protein CISIN_1g0426561mg, partial [Citrus sinensis]